MKSKGIVDGGDILEVDGVGDLQALHSIGVPPLLKMHLECPSTPVTVVSANLALIFDAKTVQLVQPVRNWLSVPSQRQVLGIVDRRISFLTL
jgi:hypothetical protein